jgi:hypothetical protein
MSFYFLTQNFLDIFSEFYIKLVVKICVQLSITPCMYIAH